VDETYVKVKGCWAYFYRAVEKKGNTIDFYFSRTRNASAAKRFLSKAISGLKDWEKPLKINADKAPSYGIAIAQLKAEGKYPEETIHHQVKYLNNIVEADHGKLKRLIKENRGSVCTLDHFLQQSPKNYPFISDIIKQLILDEQLSTATSLQN
jgi:transposase, IS6 family